MPLADHSIARLGHLDPRAGEITDGLRDHEPRVIGHLLQNLPFGILPLSVRTSRLKNSDRDLPSVE